MKISLPFFDNLGGPILIGIFVFLFVMERIFKLRQPKEDTKKRIMTNALVASVSFVFLRLLLIPAMVWIASLGQSTGIGLLNLIALPEWAKFAMGFLLLDYANYLWHALNHKVEFLWRFHNVHHTDLDLDVTTALRFHFMEILLSVVSRGGIILLIGASPFLVLVYEIIFEAASNFHHSNVKLPFHFERMINKVIVTPRMHGIHHSIIRRETDSNYSVIFSFWDRIHSTLRLNVSPSEINIGVPAYRELSEQSFLKLITMPFKKQREWRLPDGTVPDRPTRKYNKEMRE